MKLNYAKLIALEPTIYGSMKNSIGQLIEFVEHPTRGEDSPVLCICHELQIAAVSDFYELDDMTAEHGEYEPIFIDGVFYHGAQ